MSDNQRTRPRVLVTGASGFLGGRVVEAMHLSGRAEPISAIRQWSRAARVARFAGERYPGSLVLCDILNVDQVDHGVTGVDAIVHCAYTDHRESIVTGTRNLLQSALDRGVSRFVFLSTAEVYGPNVTGDVDEQAPTGKLGRSYGDAKIEAEALCREFASRGLAVTILRPSIIYGPHGASWTKDIAMRLLSGKWGWFDELGDGTANLVYVDDLVSAIFLALDSDGSGCDVFNVNGPDRLSWNEYFSKFNAALGLPPLAKRTPSQSRFRTAFMGAVGKCSDLVRSQCEDRLMEIYLRGGWASKIMKRIKGNLDATPSSGELNDLYSRRARYVDTAIRDRLGYQPHFDIERGIDQSIAWLRHHELVPRAADDAATSDADRELAQL